jgi:hypothetical protein
MLEPYLDTPGGVRKVQYFDKSRMEINDPRANPSNPWFVTNGLLAKELITGELQVGDNDFKIRFPATVQVAGDTHPDTPVYASFYEALDGNPVPVGTTLQRTIYRDGRVADSPDLARHGVTAAYYIPETDKTIASVFWDFMNSSGPILQTGRPAEGPLFENPFFAVGLPITGAYWAHVPVAGTWQDVLVQCFERRCLTYTPNNPEAWRVEAGNIGQHYYLWRYGGNPASPHSGQPEPFTEGIHLVGFEIAPGLYRATDPDGLCYWERLGGFHGARRDINANGLTHHRAVVEILPTDAGLRSENCGVWTPYAEETRDDPRASFGGGTWVVGDEISPGRWQSTGESGACFWARLGGFSGRLHEVHESRFGSAGGTIEIQPSDRGFVTWGCGMWQRDGD